MEHIDQSKLNEVFADYIDKLPSDRQARQLELMKQDPSKVVKDMGDMYQHIAKRYGESSENISIEGRFSEAVAYVLETKAEVVMANPE